MEYRIVVVDDEKDLCNNLKIELEYTNPDFKVQCFSNGYEALKVIFEGKADLVLSDIAMPDMDGYELYTRVKEYNDALPVVLMTGFGYDPNHVVVRTKSVGNVDVVPKPYQIERLMGLLLQRLGG